MNEIIKDLIDETVHGITLKTKNFDLILDDIYFKTDGATGPQGPRGERGLEGPQGPQGPQGSNV